jgi:hypothetical protein
MTDKIVLKPENKPAPKAKHFEELWEEAEKLFDADKLKVDSILNELQAKVSLYRLLGAGSFDAAELASAQASMIGKMLMTLASLSLKENVNTYAALAEAIQEKRLMTMEMSLGNNSDKMGKLLTEMQAKAKSEGNQLPIGINQELMNAVIGAVEKLTKTASAD